MQDANKVLKLRNVIEHVYQPKDTKIRKTRVTKLSAIGSNVVDTFPLLTVPPVARYVGCSRAYCELGRYKNALICIQAVAYTRPSIVTRTFFFFLSMHVHVLLSRVYLRHHVPSCTFHRARVLAYATFTRMPLERVRGSSWNSMGTCAYGDGRVTCLPSGPCKHETTLGVETPRETIAILFHPSYFI